MNNHDLLAIRDYITERDEHNYDTISKDVVVIDVTHSNLQQRHIEIRLYKYDVLDTLRNKIYRQTGTSEQYQHIQIYYDTSRDHLACEIPASTLGDTYKIGYFISNHGMTIHVIDMNPYSISANRALEDTSLITKYQLSDEEYNNKQNTLRQWKNEQKVLDPTFTLQKHAKQHMALQNAKSCYKRGVALPSGYIFDTKTNQVIRSSCENNENETKESAIKNIDECYGIDSIQHITIGQRCQITIGQRRGTIVWTGTLHHDVGYWVGIQLDEPTGKNNGTIHGTTYFVVDMNYGAIVRGSQVEVGDFPIRDDIWDEDDDDDEI